MDHADHMRRTLGLAVTAIRGADPTRFGDPTPCTEFTVGQVIDHVASALLLARHSADREKYEWTDGTSPVLAGKPESEWAQACADEEAASAAAWADPATWDGDTFMGETPMPAAAIGSMMTSEYALHAWDIAVATGQRLDVPDALGQVVLNGVLPIAQMGRDSGWYGAEVSLPADASPFERALAASGRDPRWTPTPR